MTVQATRGLVCRVIAARQALTRHATPGLRRHRTYASAGGHSPYTLVCPHFDTCSGCVLDKDLDQPPLLRVAQQFWKAEFGCSVTLHTGAVTGWRSRARLAVRGTPGSPKLGLFAAGTHEVVAVPHCPVHHPSLNAVAAACLHTAIQLGTAPYEEETRGGRLRYVQLETRGAEPGAQVDVTLVWCTDPGGTDAELLRFADVLRRTAPAGMVANVWVNHNTQPGNAIVDDRPQRWRHLSGDAGWHWERFGGADVAFTPACFLQANYTAFEELVTVGLGSGWAADPSSCHVADVYAGTGALGLSLLARGLCRQLTAIEVVPGVAEAFDAAVSRLPAHMQDRAAMHVADAGGADALAILAASGADVVVVDPPRKGLDTPLLQALCDPHRLASVRRLLYVSCGFKALQRDAVALRKHGWALEREPACWQLFPGTDALETVVHFVR